MININIELNEAHSEQKHKMSVAQLVALSDVGFKDYSSEDNKCASFVSPCGNYELFFTNNNEYLVSYEDEEGHAWWLGSVWHLSQAIQLILQHEA